MLDEGPSPEDIERFSHGSGYCPHCGEDIFDGVDRCPHCDRWLMSGPQLRSPVEHEFRRRMITIIVIITLIAFLGLFGLIRLL